MKRSYAVLSAVLLAACGAPVDDVSIDGSHFARSEMRADNGQYIVVFNDDAVDADSIDQHVAEQARTHSADVVATYRYAVRGYTARMSEAAAIALSRDPRVALVEEDGIVTADTTQSGATWGLDRADQRALPLNGTYNYNVTGSGVTAYIIDTGIHTAHNDFGGRASGGFTAISDGGGTEDCHGHGTHVSGTVGGATYGIAKGVSLVAVRVLDCGGSGTTSGVISGVDWVTQHHTAKAVANMSLGGGLSSSLDNAVANSIASGVTYAIAAGNSNRDACKTSPADVRTAITVGATTSTDARASYSNYGACLDLFAPGSSITSDWYTSNTATNTISGTSMATPHVTGAAALYLQNHTATPAQVSSALTGNATAGVVGSPGRNSPNLLLYTAFIL